MGVVAAAAAAAAAAALKLAAHKVRVRRFLRQPHRSAFGTDI